MMKHLKSANFVLNLLGLFSSLFIIVFAAYHLDHIEYIGVGVVLLMLNINNFVKYYKKQRKEESASAKLKFKGE